MQLPGGSTRIPPARAPASVLVIINGSNIVSKTVTKKRNGKCSNSSENGGPGTNSDRYIRNNDRNNDPENVPRLLIRNRHPETRTSRRQARVIEKPQLLASTPRRKDRGEE